MNPHPEQPRRQRQPSRLERTMHVMIAGTLLVLAVLLAPIAVRASDLEAEAWPEFDIWIKVDDAGKNRIYILSSFTEEPNFQYQESALGISWDQRIHKNWAWRVGARYITKAVDPPDKNETRVVLDLKWYHELGGGWLFTDRNRLDLRKFDGDQAGSYRYRNRVQLEKPFPVFSQQWAGFASYELYYDSRFDEWGQRQRVIAGVSVPLSKWASVDVFYGYHLEIKPKRETGSALGVAFGLSF